MYIVSFCFSERMESQGIYIFEALFWVQASCSVAVTATANKLSPSLISLYTVQHHHSCERHVCAKSGLRMTAAK